MMSSLSKTVIHVLNGRKEMDECDGYMPDVINGCLQFVDEWWDERGMNLCHNCGIEQRAFWEDDTYLLESEDYYA